MLVQQQTTASPVFRPPFAGTERAKARRGMKARELKKYVCEYSRGLRLAANEGWLAALVAAHATPCTEATARRILHDLKRLNRLPEHKLSFRNQRGRAKRLRGGKGYGIYLPNVAGTGFARLRVGIVLHEAAHIYDVHSRGALNHAYPFWQQLRRLVEANWRRHFMPALNFREIYDRHPGPYALVITKQSGKRQFCETLTGPYTGPEAHKRATTLVKDASSQVTEAYTYSNKEGQFIGTCYQRGNEYLPWEDGGGLDLAARRQEGTLLPEEPERVRQVGPDLDEGLHPRTNRARTLHRVPTTKGSRLRIVEGESPWPKSPAAQLVRVTVGRQPMTSAEICAAIGKELNDLGVAFPASLVSRLKQAGLLKDVSDEA